VVTILGAERLENSEQLLLFCLAEAHVRLLYDAVQLHDGTRLGVQQLQQLYLR